MEQGQKILGAFWPGNDIHDGSPATDDGVPRVPVRVGRQAVQWESLGDGVIGRWEPETNGDPENPELIFYNGDVVMYRVGD